MNGICGHVGCLRKAISGQKLCPKHQQARRCERCKTEEAEFRSSYCKTCYWIYWKGEDSPPMNVPEAVAALWAGEKLFAENWESGEYIKKSNDVVRDENGKSYGIDILTNNPNWHIYTPPEPPVEFGWKRVSEDIPGTEPVEAVPRGERNLLVKWKAGHKDVINGKYVESTDITHWSYIPKPEDKG